MTWTREHDALIARVAEGAKILTCEEALDLHRVHNSSARRYYMELADNYWYVTPDGEAPPVPAYNTDIVACLRAAEAWRKQDPENRRYDFDSPWYDGDTFTATTTADAGMGIDFPSLGTTASEAIAIALYRACGGTV